MFADARIGRSEDRTPWPDPGRCSSLLNTRTIRNLFRFGRVEVDFCPQGFPGAVPLEFAAAGAWKRTVPGARACFDTPDGN